MSEDALTKLENLLAIIHRDGGHRVGEIGLDAACVEAAVKYYQLLKKIDNLEAELSQCRESYRTREACGHFQNYLIGDDYGNTTCVVCERDSIKAQLALVESRDYLY